MSQNVQNPLENLLSNKELRYIKCTNPDIETRCPPRLSQILYDPTLEA